MGTALDFSLEPRDGVGGRLCEGAALGRDVRMTVDPALGVFIGPPDGIGYVPGEGTQ